MPSFLPSTPQLVILAAMGIMIWVLWRRSSRHFGRGGTAHQPAYKVSKLDNDRDLSLIDAPPEVTRWQVEMHELARDLKGEIDTKLALLSILIRQADAAAQRLEQATQRAQDESGATDSLAAIESFRANAAVAPPSTPLPQTQRVYALADRGLAPSAIAAETGIALGDVELALSLRASRATPS